MTLKATALIPALLGALTLSLAACKTTGAGDIGSTLSAGSKLVTAATLSDAVALRYFSHTDDARRSLGA